MGYCLVPYRETNCIGGAHSPELMGVMRPINYDRRGSIKEWQHSSAFEPSSTINHGSVSSRGYCDVGDEGGHYVDSSLSLFVSLAVAVSFGLYLLTQPH